MDTGLGLGNAGIYLSLLPKNHINCYNLGIDVDPDWSYPDPQNLIQVNKITKLRSTHLLKVGKKIIFKSVTEP